MKQIQPAPCPGSFEAHRRPHACGSPSPAWVDGRGLPPSRAQETGTGPEHKGFGHGPQSRVRLELGHPLFSVSSQIR